MKNQLDIARYLLVFNQILSRGERIDQHYHYPDMEAWHDFDGYTCFLAFHGVTLTMFFHGHYQLDYPNQKAFSAFQDKVEREFTHR